MTDKTSVDDIIGIVKTEEPTNSVQLKKEAQLSICEKRVRELEKENEQLKQENEWLKSIHFANDVLKENKLLKEKLNEILELTELTGMIHLRKAEIKSIIKR